MKLKFFSLLAAFGAVAADNCNERICMKNPIPQPMCRQPEPMSNGMMALSPATGSALQAMTHMRCYCNCCEKTENGRSVDTKSCVQKDFLGMDMNNAHESCSCYCQMPEAGPGAPGCLGETGGYGDDGIPGRPGMPGKDGIHGKPGYAGNHGNDGQHKPDCDDGNDGNQGKLGVVGRDGEQGPAARPGGNGRPGQPGKPGVNGPPGGPGSKGRPGERGPRGFPGPQGSRGTNGRPGAVGHPGKRGGDGANGAQGKAGMPGNPGRPGARGETGVRGVNGADGAMGARGKTGLEGPVGRPGRNGRDSTMRGHPGAPGANGMQGEAGDDADFDWRAIEVMVANSLWAKLMKPSQHCGELTEMCKCGEVKIVEPALPPPEKQVLDVILLMDGSDSIQIRDWPHLKNWVVKFMNSFSHPDYMNKYAKTSTKVVVQYSSYDFAAVGSKNPGYIVKKRLLHQLKAFEQDLNEMIQLAHGTDTFTAIEFVLKEIIPKTLDPRGDHKRQLILLTNGVPRDADVNYTDEGQRSYSNAELYRALSKNFDDRFVVGIGSEISSNHVVLDQISSNSHGGEAMWFVEGIHKTSDHSRSYLNDEIMEAILSEMRISLLG